MNIPHHAILIIMYEKMQKLLNPSKEYNALVHCTAGATAGAIAAAVTTPLDVCKTLLNTQETSILNQIHQSKVTGLQNAVKTIYMMQGYKGFFRGLKARILYQMPSTAIAWTIYELFKHYMTHDQSACNPEEGSDLIKDGVLTESLYSSSSDGDRGVSKAIAATGLVVQEKQRLLHTGPGSSTVDRLRTLNVGSSLTASCAAASPDDKLLVK